MEENIAVQDNETLDAGEIKDLRDLKRKMHFTGTVISTTLAGALVDIGLEVPGVVHISQLSEEPVNRVEDVVKLGQTVDVWVRQVVPSKERVELTMIEPLPLEWREIKKDMVVHGKVTRIEKFGVFVDIGAERPGLVHISEITHGYIKTPEDVIKEGEEVDVKVLSVNRFKKQIKLSMKALEENPIQQPKKEKKEKKPVNAGKVEEPEEEAVPTAMEMALREAMERKETPQEATADSNQEDSQSDDFDDILSRTLEQRVKSK
jgi:ribosomal protein S1